LRKIVFKTLLCYFLLKAVFGNHLEFWKHFEFLKKFFLIYIKITKKFKAFFFQIQMQWRPLKSF
jgi:hypothetical protein